MLIFDGTCPFCSAAASALRRIEAVGILTWYDDAAQNVLEAQFEEPPFALVLLDPHESRVYVGGAAATELADRAGVPDPIGDFLGERYEPMAETIQRSVGSATAPEPVHAVLPLADDAKARFGELVEAAEPKPRPASGSA